MKIGFRELTLLVTTCGLAAVAVFVIRVNFSRGPKAYLGPTRQTIAQVSTGIDMFEVDCGRLPSNLQELVTSPVEDGWNGPYLTDDVQMLDVWGRKMHYALDGKSYRITSAGPDGVFGSEDDISGF